MNSDLGLEISDLNSELVTRTLSSSSSLVLQVAEKSEEHQPWILQITILLLNNLYLILLVTIPFNSPFICPILLPISLQFQIQTLAVTRTRTQTRIRIRILIPIQFQTSFCPSPSRRNGDEVDLGVRRHRLWTRYIYICVYV